MTVVVYKGLTRYPEIGNTSIWVLPIFWRLGQVRNTKFRVNVSSEITNAAKYHVYCFYRFWVIKGKSTGEGVKNTPPTQIRVKGKSKLDNLKYDLAWNVSQQLLIFALETLNGYFWSWFYLKIDSFTSTKFWSFIGKFSRLQLFLKDASSQTYFCNASPSWWAL